MTEYGIIDARLDLDRVVARGDELPRG